jgi:predicted naringenin-chalcone synthase
MIIAGLGTALPRHSIAQGNAAALATGLSSFSDEQARRLEKLYRLTRVERRYSVLLEDQNEDRGSQTFFNIDGDFTGGGPGLSARMERYESEAPLLACAAARNALDRAGTSSHEITHLITVSCSGFAAPGTDIALIKALELPPGTQRTNVGFMGCHGALNGLRVARGFTDSDPRACVLLVAVELCSLHYQYSLSDETNLANGLFSDGAAALVARSDTELGTDAWCASATGSFILPESEAAMTWKVREHGFQMTLGREVPTLIHTHLPAWMESWLAAEGLGICDIATWAVHPGGPAILSGVREALGLKNEQLEASWEVLKRYGNMSSPTILFVLDYLRDAGAPRPCVALGFGPGLAVEAVLFR